MLVSMVVNSSMACLIHNMCEVDVASLDSPNCYLSNMRKVN